MANRVYNKFRQLLGAPTGTLGATAGTNINFATDKFDLLLVNTVAPGTIYTQADTHAFVSDVTAAAIIARASGAGNSHAGTAGFTATYDPNTGEVTLPNVTFNNVPAGTYEAIILCKTTGTDTTSPLLLYIDTDVTGLPYTAPAGNGNLQIIWNVGAGKAIKIA